jgi:hypothetical protein
VAIRSIGWPLGVQIATDVIRDNFWTLFQDPDHDLYITDARYRGHAAAGDAGAER